MMDRAITTRGINGSKYFFKSRISRDACEHTFMRETKKIRD